MNNRIRAGCSSLLIAVWLVLVAPLGMAATGADQAPVAPMSVDRSADDWLALLGPGLNTTSYRGVFIYARGDQVHSMRIAHRYRDGQVQERLVLQDGGSGEIVRKGMDVVCVLPDQGRVRLDDVIPSGPFAEALSKKVMPVLQTYEPQVLGEARVAGYDAIVIALQARDSHRYSHRLWLEKTNGLLVKSQVRGADGAVLEHFQFTSLEITEDIKDEELRIQTRGREVTRSLEAPAGAQSPAEVRTEGWRLTWRPDGFYAAAAPRSGRREVVAFSDGLAAFSVFVEPAHDLTMPTGASRVGATTIYIREKKMAERTLLIAVVGEIPPATARKLADSVQIDDATALGWMTR